MHQFEQNMLGNVRFCTTQFLKQPVVHLSGWLAYFFLQYTLETFAEKRDTKWKFAPYFGGPVDGPHNGPAPMPWAIQTQSPSAFQDHVQHICIPHTESVRVSYWSLWLSQRVLHGACDYLFCAQCVHSCSIPALYIPPALSQLWWTRAVSLLDLFWKRKGQCRCDSCFLR